jgi:uncharacterized membrane protein
MADRCRHYQHGSDAVGVLCLELWQVVIVEPLVSSNPVLTLLLTAIFLRDLEALSLRVIIGAVLTVAGTILVVTVR